jgi:radical SAM protein with 4Fe4S-binding SPASM domain
MPELSPSAGLNAFSLERNIPLSVTIELTRRCPLKCLHCYLPETRGRAAAGAELGTAAWKKILRDLASAGGLYLAFTGGEPLLRKDLPELCAFAKELNFDVRVFSTGLGLTPRLARGFARAGVSAFEISFYGPGPVHDAVTGTPGSFSKTLAAARTLQRAGVQVKMKVPLMKLNLGRAGWLRKLARAEGFRISFDPVITPANDGDRSALAQRLAGAGLARAVKLLSGPAAAGGAEQAGAADFICGAGRNVCAVGPGGELYPCLQVQVGLGRLRGGNFASLWKKSAWLKKWRAAGVKDLKGCAGCAKAEFCSLCPGVSLLETGNLFAPNAAACELAGIRKGLSGRAGKRSVS